MRSFYMDDIAYKKAFLLTKGGVVRLRQKLEGLLKKRIEISKQLRALDNYEKADPMVYNQQIAELERTEMEADKLTNILHNAQTVTAPDNPFVISIGSTISLQDSAQVLTYTLVSALEADPSEYKISEESPLGMALLGKKLQETVSIHTPRGGELSYRIIAIK